LQKKQKKIGKTEKTLYICKTNAIEMAFDIKENNKNLKL